VVTIAGSLVFPTSDCGGAPAGGQSVTLTNSTHQAYTYTLKFFAGAHYTLTDGGSGTLAASGVSTIVVNPVAVTPGPGVLPGSAPYADDLIVTLDTSPATTFTVPISWTLDGAVLSLIQGAGPYGAPGSNFYAADSTSGFPLGISNTGTAAATVNFGIQSPGAFNLAPAPVQVLPGIPALPELVSGASAPTCPTTSSGTATFAYSGPVCQPLPFASVEVESCSGTYVPTVVPPPAADAGADAGGGDATAIEAGSDASGASSPVPCTGGTYPSNTPAGCVPCLGNRQTGAEAGECTPTEQLVMSYDIVKNGMTPTSDTVAATSCYYCLVAGTCLDSAAANSVVGIGIAHVVTHNKSNLECEDPQTADDVAATNPGDCRDALQCILTGGGTLSAGSLTGGTGECTSATPPASTDPNASVGNCYCGTATGANCLAAGKANGACVTNITTDVGSFLASNNPTNISGALTDGSQSPGGVSDQILNCGLTADCDVCFK